MERKEEEKLLLSKITDKINFCERKNKIQVTDFLDLSQKQQVYIFLNTKKIKNYLFYGGVEAAERVAVVFYPEKLENIIQNINLNEYIKAIHFDEIKVPFVPFYSVIIYLINHPKLRNAIKNFIPPVVE